MAKCFIPVIGGCLDGGYFEAEDLSTAQQEVMRPVRISTKFYRVTFYQLVVMNINGEMQPRYRKRKSVDLTILQFNNLCRTRRKP